MTLQVECEIDFDVMFDYKKIAEDIINASLDYMRCPFETEINLTITDNERIREINKEFRNINTPTDVLSFPLIDYVTPGCFDNLEEKAEDYFNLDTGELMLGDIIISAERIKSQAEEYGHSQLREFCFLIVHSMLHLAGYDHIDEEERLIMECHQKAILDKAGIVR